MQKVLSSLVGLALGSGCIAALDAKAATFLPDFSTATFDSNSSISDNSYFPLIPSNIYTYGGEKIDPITGEIEAKRNEVFVTFETKKAQIFLSV